MHKYIENMYKSRHVYFIKINIFCTFHGTKKTINYFQKLIPSQNEMIIPIAWGRIIDSGCKLYNTKLNLQYMYYNCFE